MKTFINIASNPLFSVHVKELVYDGRLFLPELADYSTYKLQFDALAGSRILAKGRIGDMVLIGLEMTSEEYCQSLGNSLVHYARPLESQQTILDEGADFACLSKGLSDFPNLSKVSLINTAGFRGENPFLEDNHEWYNQTSAEDIGLAIGPSEWPCREGNATIGIWDTRGIQNLIRALANCSSKVVECFKGSQISIVDMCREDREKACVLAQDLTRLEIYIDANSEYDPEDTDAYERRKESLAQILKVAGKLRHFSYDGRPDESIFLNLHCSELATLKLGDMGFVGKNLIRIFELHKDSLRELRLRNVFLDGQVGWKALGKQMGNFPRLHYFQVWSLGDEVTAEETEDPYLEEEVHVELARMTMQWVAKGMLEIESSCGRVTAKLKSGPQQGTSPDTAKATANVVSPAGGVEASAGFPEM